MNDEITKIDADIAVLEAQKQQETDVDSIETQEWLDALTSLVKYEGSERAKFILDQLRTHVAQLGVNYSPSCTTPYINTIKTNDEQKMPDDGSMLQKTTNLMRWNAVALVLSAGRKNLGLGGHLGSYAAMATLFEVGLNYFFHAKNDTHGGDLVFFQGHSSEGLYARAFLEGRFTEEHMLNFRQEISGKGLSSYPHPKLMPEFWQFPTVSLGLGPIMAVYQAQFLKYLHNRGLLNTENRKVWAFSGDGETSEPESSAALLFAGREQLDNLIVIVNCNLQRLDGPVMGNEQVIQQLEGFYRGAGWNVIKVIWGSNWEKLFNADKKGVLLRRISELVDGEYQNFSAKGGAYMRQHFFGKSPELLALVADMSDADIAALEDGGHDPQKVYAAYAAAAKHQGQPTVILIKTVKGYGLGKEGHGVNLAHNLDKLNPEGLKEFRDRFALPLSDKEVEQLKFYRPADNSEEINYLQQQRAKLGGYLPARDETGEVLAVPDLSAFQALLESSGDREVTTSVIFSRVVSLLLKDAHLKDRIVPILADETRTLGLEGLFRQIGMYSPKGQLYTPEDKENLVYYREMKNGQLLQQGISEAAAMASWIAAGTSYANNQKTMIPIYTYYAMFGYQRIGDLVWAAGDIKARGFIVAGLAGRTTLPGEGLQHQDSHNVLMYSVVPCCRAYDPTFSYEFAVIFQHGLQEMIAEQKDVFYYLTMMNERYQHPAMPKGVEEDIIKGMYLFKEAKKTATKAKDKKANGLQVQLLGSGAILLEVIKAAEILQNDFKVASDIWSVPSFNELRRDIESVARHNRLHPDVKPQQSHVTKCLTDRQGPTIAATDYMKLFADQIRSAVPNPYYVLGTDGFGRSDSRPNLRDFFEVDAKMIAYTALKALADQGDWSTKELLAAREKLKIDANRPDPWTC